MKLWASRPTSAITNFRANSEKTWRNENSFAFEQSGKKFGSSKGPVFALSSAFRASRAFQKFPALTSRPKKRKMGHLLEGV